jgi:hypothetical protein
MAPLAQGVRRNAHLLVLTVMTCVTLPVQVVGQASADDGWNSVVSVPGGSQVRVSLRDGAEFTARLVVARPDVIVIEDIRTAPAGVRTGRRVSLNDRLTIARANVASIALLSTPQTRATPTTPASFDQLRVLVGPGQTINVTDLSGARYSGTIVSLSSSDLAVRVGNRVRQLREGDVATMRHRRPDTLGNGALWGFGAGFSTGMVMCGRCHLGPGAGIGLMFGGIGAGIGVGIDALIRGDVVVFQRPGTTGMRVSVVPQLAKSHKGVAVSIGF